MINIHQLGLSLSLIGACCQAAGTEPLTDTPTPADIRDLLLYSYSKKAILNEIINQPDWSHLIHLSKQSILAYPVSGGSRPDEPGRTATPSTSGENLSHPHQVAPDANWDDYYDDEEDDAIGSGGPMSLISAMAGSMYESMIANPVGADLSSEEKDAVEFNATVNLYIDSSIYPYFFDLIQLAGHAAEIRGRLKPALMADINSLIEKVLKQEGKTLEELTSNHKLFQWIRWLRASNIIHTLNRIYCDIQNQPDGMNSARLMVTYSDLRSMIRFYNALAGLNLDDVVFSDVVRNFLSQMVEGNIPSEESGIIPIMEQPLTIVVIAIVYQSSLIDALIKGNHIIFNLNSFINNRALYRERYSSLVASLRKVIANLLVVEEEDQSKKDRRIERCALAIIHILLNEAPLMSQLSSGSLTSVAEQPASVEAASETLFAILNSFAVHSEAQSVAVIIAMLNMPYLIGILNRIVASNQHQNLPQVFNWISERYTTIVNNTSDDSSRLILEGAIEALAHPPEVLECDNGPLTSLVNEWLITIQPESLSDAGDFEVTDIEEHTVKVDANAVISALKKLHPSIVKWTNKDASEIKKRMSTLWKRSY